MKYLKKTITYTLILLFLCCSLISTDIVKAAKSNVPEIVSIKVNPKSLIKGDKPTFTIKTKNITKAQYNIELKLNGAKKWDSLTKSYTKVMDGKKDFKFNSAKPLNVGEYTLKVTVKRATDKAVVSKVIPLNCKDNTINIGIVTDEGGIYDRSFNQSADEGLKQAVRDFKGKYSVIESMKHDDYVINFEEISKTCDLTFAVGFQMKEAITEVAKELKDKKFVLIDDVSSCPNVMSLTFKEEEGSFLMGVIAGKMTKTNKIGYIGGMDFELVNRFEVGFIAGVKSVNEEAAKGLLSKKTSKYAGSFTDAEKGYEIGKGLLNDGCDVIYHAAGGVGMGMFQAVKEAKESGKQVWAIGVDKDQAKVTPVYADITLSSMVKNINNASYFVVKSFIDNKFKGGEIKLGLKEDGVGYAKSTYKNTPKDVLKLVDAYKKAISEGKIKVPSNFKQLNGFVVPKI